MILSPRERLPGVPGQNLIKKLLQEVCAQAPGRADDFHQVVEHHFRGADVGGGDADARRMRLSPSEVGCGPSDEPAAYRALGHDGN